jgi:WD40 repeat protein
VPLVWDLDGPPDAEPLALRKGDISVVNSHALEPHGHGLATAANQMALLWPLGRPRARVIRGQTPSWSDVAFTPDGKWLASSSGGDGSVRLWLLSPAVASERRILIQEEGPGFSYLAIDPTGRNLVAIQERYAGRAVRVPLDGGTPQTLPRVSPAWLHPPAISRDGRLAAAGSRFRPEGNLIELWDLPSGQVRTLDPRAQTGEKECESGPGFRSIVTDVAFTSDGRLLSNGTSGLRPWDLDAGRNALLKPCSPGHIWSRLGGSLGDRFLLMEMDPNHQTSLFSFHDLCSGVSQELTSHSNAVLSVAIDPKGETAVTGGFDGVVRVGPVTGEEPHLLYGQEGQVMSLAVSPDGQWVASGSDDGTIRLWPMPTGRPFHTLPYDELLARLRSFTNLRVVSDEASETGYRVEAGPFPGWAVQPEW